MPAVPRDPGAAVLAALSLPLLFACGVAEDAAGGGAPEGRFACAAGELLLPDGRCQPAGLPPDMPCAPGELALLDGRCQPAGVPPEACAADTFVPDGRGGCTPILPEDQCPRGRMAVPGERVCREVAPCGDGRWGDIPVDAATEYVDQSYSGSDSDGSPERPWATVQAGVDAASPGAIVAVAEGRYVEDVVIVGKPVRLWGRCPTLTEVAGTGQREASVTLGQGASGAEVRGVAVTGPRTGIQVRSARAVVLEEVWVNEAGRFGVSVLNRAGATVRGALLERNQLAGMAALGSEAKVEATVVRASRPDSTGRFGHGISAQVDSETSLGATLSVTGSLIEQNCQIGVFVRGSEATLESTVVRTTRIDSTARLGVGIAVEVDPRVPKAGKLSLKGLLVEQNHGVGVFVEGSEATIERTVVRATQLDGDGKGGRGINVQTDEATRAKGKLSLATSLVEDNHDVGVYIRGAEATVEATVVRATQLNGTGESGIGIGVDVDEMTGVEGKLSLAASRVEDNHGHGVFVAGAEAAVEATVVRATQADGAGRFGMGIGVQPLMGAQGRLSLTGSLVEDNHDVGVFIGSSEATIEAAVVRATKPEPASMQFGDGILVVDGQGESRATITATESTDNARAGVVYVGSAGDIAGILSVRNSFGLVLQYGKSGKQPTLGESNIFEGNNEQDLITNGDMPVPDARLPLP